VSESSFDDPSVGVAANPSQGQLRFLPYRTGFRP